MITAIYVRISSDQDGQGLGVARQEADCRALVAARGWNLAEVYVDNDISAYSGRRRPDYERLLADIEAGEIRCVVAWHPDRLHRSPKELERFIDLAERTGLRIETVQAGGVDLSTASGRMVARQLGAVARFESEHKSARIRRKLAENAAEGRNHGGMRPYGWEPDRLTIRESEAAVLREVAERVLAGDSMRAIVADLNARGLHSATGRPWRHVTLRDTLLRARHGGLREHNGEEVGRASWSAIIEPETWRAVKRALTDPARITTPGRGGKLHLLSGIAVCAVCGGKLRVGQSKGHVAVYRCYPAGCVNRQADYLERIVRALVTGRLNMPDAVDLLSPPDDGGARMRAERQAELVRRRLDEAAASFAEGAITARQLATITEKLRPELAALDAAAAPPPDRAKVLGPMVRAEDADEAWERMSPDARRAAVAILLDIRIDRGRRGRGFSTEGLGITWR